MSSKINGSPDVIPAIIKRSGFNLSRVLSCLQANWTELSSMFAAWRGHRSRPMNPIADSCLDLSTTTIRTPSALVSRHGSMVLGVCRRVLGNVHDAQDAFQGTFFVLARKAGGLQWRESISNWLHSVAYRLALQVRDSVTRQRAIERRLADSAQTKESVRDSSLPELCAALDEELNRLPNRYRAALIGCYLKGQTRDQAATEGGWSLRTLDRRLHRGREILRARLERRGMSLPAVLLVAGLSGHGARANVPAALASSTARAAVAFGIRGRCRAAYPRPRSQSLSGDCSPSSS